MFLTNIFLALLAAQAGANDAHAQHGTHGPRQAEVAARGADVMPFDLERTTHNFRSLPDGGMLTLVSDDGDSHQISLIRSHLRRVATAFSTGDYASPAEIHGDDMPGLRELRAAADQVRIAYEDTELGARLRFETADEELVASVHRWFVAQRSDHGRHAID